MVVRDGARLAFVGVAIGLVAALATTRILKAMLFEVTTTDPWTYTGMIALLTGAVLIASWIPARRAASVDPIVALRKV